MEKTCLKKDQRAEQCERSSPTNLQPLLLGLPEHLFFEGCTAGHAGVLLHVFTDPLLLRLFFELSVVFTDLKQINKPHAAFK